MKKNIGIIAFCEKDHGGVNQYLISMVEALRINNIHNYIIFTSTKETRFDNLGFEVRKIDLTRISLISKWLRYFQLFFLIRRPLFFSQTEIDAYQDVAAFISPRISPYPHFYLGKPFIFTLHDFQERYYPRFFPFKERVARRLFNYALTKTCTKVIVESRYVKDDMERFLRPNMEKVCLIPSPPPANFLKYNLNDETLYRIRRKYDLPSEYLFYPANFWYHKNHITLIKAFKNLNKKFKNLNLIFSGSKGNSYGQVIEFINRQNLEKKVRYLGYVDYDDLPSIYRMAKLVVVPSLFESISLPIYEAFSVKIPVACSNIFALPEQIKDGGLTFNPKDPKDIAQKIDLILADENLAQQLTHRGYQIIKNFNHHSYMNNLTELLNKIDHEVE